MAANIQAEGGSTQLYAEPLLPDICCSRQAGDMTMHGWLSSTWSFLREAQTLLTFVIGLAAGTYLTRRADKLRQLEIMRTSAYADFVRGISGLAVTQRSATEASDDELRFMALTADAKARIAIYGSTAVVVSLAEFMRGGAVIDNLERAEAFSGVCSKMRSDSIAGEALASEDMFTLLFGPDKDFDPSATQG